MTIFLPILCQVAQQQQHVRPLCGPSSLLGERRRHRRPLLHLRHFHPFLPHPFLPDPFLPDPHFHRCYYNHVPQPSHRLKTRVHRVGSIYDIIQGMRLHFFGGCRLHFLFRLIVHSRLRLRQLHRQRGYLVQTCLWLLSHAYNLHLPNYPYFDLNNLNIKHT